MTKIQPTTDEEQGSANSALSLDLEAYRPMLADAGMTREQETRFLEALWLIMVGFVDLGFGRDPVQQLTNVSMTREALVERADRVISCADTFNTQSNFKAAKSGRCAARKKES